MHKKMILSGPMSALRARFGDKGGIRLMAETGFDAVDYTFNEMTDGSCVWNTDEYRSYAEEMNRIAAENGVFFNQAHAPFLFDWDTMWQTPAFEEVILPRILRSFECAALLKIPAIVVHPIHHIRYHGNEKMLWDWNLAYYKQLLPAAKHFGVRIMLENMWQVDPLRGCGDSDVFSHPSEFRDMVDALDDPFAAACVDVGHAGLAGEDPADLIRTLGDRVQALHIHDNFHKIDDHTLPYLGKLDWESITGALKDVGYHYDFTYEVTNYLKPFPDELCAEALRFQVTVGRQLIGKISG